MWTPLWFLPPSAAKSWRQACATVRGASHPNFGRQLYWTFDQKLSRKPEANHSLEFTVPAYHKYFFWLHVCSKAKELHCLHGSYEPKTLNIYWK